MTLPDIAFLLVAGVVAGIIGTAGGITSLVSYPALSADREANASKEHALGFALAVILLVGSVG
jgi:hypothetical protein